MLFKDIKYTTNKKIYKQHFLHLMWTVHDNLHLFVNWEEGHWLVSQGHVNNVLNLVQI